MAERGESGGGGFPSSVPKAGSIAIGAGTALSAYILSGGQFWALAMGAGTSWLTLWSGGAKKYANWSLLGALIPLILSGAAKQIRRAPRLVGLDGAGDLSSGVLQPSVSFMRLRS